MTFQNSKHAFQRDGLREQQDYRTFHSAASGMEKSEERWVTGQGMMLSPLPATEQFAWCSFLTRSYGTVTNFYFQETCHLLPLPIIYYPGWFRYILLIWFFCQPNKIGAIIPTTPMEKVIVELSKITELW